MTLNSSSSCLYLLSTEIAGMCDHAQFYAVLMKPWIMLEKQAL